MDTNICDRKVHVTKRIVRSCESRYLAITEGHCLIIRQVVFIIYDYNLPSILLYTYYPNDAFGKIGSGYRQVSWISYLLSPEIGNPPVYNVRVLLAFLPDSSAQFLPWEIVLMFWRVFWHRFCRRPTADWLILVWHRRVIPACWWAVDEKVRA